MEEHSKARVVWNSQERTLTLEGEPVLQYTLAWPQVEGAGLGGKWISRYYARLAKHWRERWEREVYWAACLELAACREAAHPFYLWQGGLTGETVLLQGDTLSLRFQGWEIRRAGRPARVRWGDVWKIREGTPRPLRSLFAGKKSWKGRMWQALVRQGEARRQAGDCFLDSDWEEKARAAHPLRNWCLTESGVEVSLPQCIAAPAAEGCPTFLLPLEPDQA